MSELQLGNVQTLAGTLRARVIELRARVLMLRGRITTKHSLVIAAVALCLVTFVGILVNWAAPRSSAHASSIVVQPANVNDPLVNFRSSDGHNGAPLALISGIPVFPLSGSGLLGYDFDAPVEMEGEHVVSVADGGFWIGQDGVQRVFVTIPRSAIDNGALRLDQLSVNENVNISGRVAPLPDAVASLGVKSDGEKLTNQGELVVANSVRLPG